MIDVGSQTTHDARRSYLDVVVLTQVGRLQVEVAEVQFDLEAIGNADVPVQLRLLGIRLREVWRLQAAVHFRAGSQLGVNQQREDEKEQTAVGGSEK